MPRRWRRSPGSASSRPVSNGTTRTASSSFLKFRPLAGGAAGQPEAATGRRAGFAGIVGPACHACRVRPALKPGLLPVWRDRDTLQIGIDPRRAVALTGMAGAAWMISLLDGSRDRAQVIAAAGDRGMPPQLADRVLTLLAAGGALDDFPAGTYRVLPRQLRALLAPELAAAALANGASDGGARTLARRRAAHVRIMGGGRLELGIAGILTESGIGRVDSKAALGREADTQALDAGTLGREAGTLGQGTDAQGRGLAGTTPGRGPGSAATLPGRVRGPAGMRSGPARERAAREHTTRARGTRPDLAVLIGIPDPELAARLMSERIPHLAVSASERIPHLAVSASEAIGVVGPLVLPGRSACLRCLDLARTDRDPAWPLILAQLASRPAAPP